MGLAVGIDLGTTNTLAAIFTETGEIELVLDSNGSPLLPSAVSISDKGTTIVGRGAKSRLVQAPDKSVAAFKRSIGTGKEFKLGKTVLSAVELSSLVLAELFGNIKARCDTPIGYPHRKLGGYRSGLFQLSAAGTNARRSPACRP